MTFHKASLQIILFKNIYIKGFYVYMFYVYMLMLLSFSYTKYSTVYSKIYIGSKKMFQFLSIICKVQCNTHDHSDKLYIYILEVHLVPVSMVISGSECSSGDSQYPASPRRFLSNTWWYSSSIQAWESTTRMPLLWILCTNSFCGDKCIRAHWTYVDTM